MMERFWGAESPEEGTGQWRHLSPSRVPFENLEGSAFVSLISVDCLGRCNTGTEGRSAVLRDPEPSSASSCLGLAADSRNPETTEALPGPDTESVLSLVLKAPCSR